ncbi:MAG: hypothetical protein AAB937_00175 [Patescibacteria group bacterium]
MINRFYRSKFDIENLSKLRTSIPTDVDNFNYRGIVVNKPWGYEYLLYENHDVAAWVLHLNNNHKTSMHCHPNKKTSLIVVSGEVVCSTLEGWLTRKQGDGIIIEEGVFHTTRAVSKGGALVIEVECPPNKKDLVRLKDAYGREDQGYEGASQMSKNLDAYTYVDFHTYSNGKKMEKLLDHTTLTIAHHPYTKDVGECIRKARGELFCLLKGKLHDVDGRLILSAGEVALVSSLRNMTHIENFSDILYLTLSYGKNS